MKTLFENTEEIVGKENANNIDSISKNTLEGRNYVVLEATGKPDIKPRENNPEANSNFREMISQFDLIYLEILKELSPELIDVYSHLDSKCINCKKNNDCHKLQ